MDSDEEEEDEDERQSSLFQATHQQTYSYPACSGASQGDEPDGSRQSVSYLRAKYTNMVIRQWQHSKLKRTRLLVDFNIHIEQRTLNAFCSTKFFCIRISALSYRVKMRRICVV